LANVVIVDYGIGNLLSVKRAVEACGEDATISADAHLIRRAERIILPGVGAFPTAMESLRTSGLIEVLGSVAQSGIPMLGICLGMQLFLQESEEHAKTKGLGFIPGQVKRIPSYTTDGLTLNIPHIGWSNLSATHGADLVYNFSSTNSCAGAVYFVHSFMATPNDPCATLAHVVYGGNLVPAIISEGNITGFQFHPEKSGSVGLEILLKWLQYER